MISDKTSKLVAGGLFIPLAVGMGYALIQFPNVELVTAVVFLSGYFLGWKMGGWVGATTMFIYSTFNPYGMAIPPVLVMQIFGMAISGIAGGVFGSISRSPTGWRLIVALAVMGFFLTVLYDFLTTFGHVIVIQLSVQSLADTAHAFAVAVVFGIGFYITHIVSNTIIFAAFVPIVLRKLAGNRFLNHPEVSHKSASTLS
jgi:hypothetical protein